MTDWRIEPAPAPLRGELRVPSDKSISHRAVMLASLADGQSLVRNALEGEDVLATQRAMRALGAQIERNGNELTVAGAPELRSPRSAIDCGNAGTLIRLLAGAVCGRGISCALDGDSSLRNRPMRRISAPLAQMGASIATSPTGTAPLLIKPARKLSSIVHRPEVASAQVKSAVLLAGLTAAGGATVIEPHPSRDHTEKMLPLFGATVLRKDGRIRVRQCARLTPAEIGIPADPSSAAFFIVAATVVPGSDLLLREVGTNPLRTGGFALLSRMGARIEMLNRRMLNAEPVADVRVRHARLHGITIRGADVPAAIDEFPVLFAAAAHAEGVTELSGASELRAKESDRIAAMASALCATGISATEKSDGITITGGTMRPGTVDSRGDHRVAMAMAVAAAAAGDAIMVQNCENVATSFPGFAAMCDKAGWKVEEQTS